MHHHVAGLMASMGSFIQAPSGPGKDALKESAMTLAAQAASIKHISPELAVFATAHVGAAAIIGITVQVDVDPLGFIERFEWNLVLGSNES